MMNLPLPGCCAVDMYLRRIAATPTTPAVRNRAVEGSGTGSSCIWMALRFVSSPAGPPAVKTKPPSAPASTEPKKAVCPGGELVTLKLSVSPVNVKSPITLATQAPETRTPAFPTPPWQLGPGNMKFGAVPVRFSKLRTAVENTSVSPVAACQLGAMVKLSLARFTSWKTWNCSPDGASIVMMISSPFEIAAVKPGPEHALLPDRTIHLG